MLKPPPAGQCAAKSEPPNNVKQSDYLNLMKNNGCVGCHQLGQLSTRTIPKFHSEERSSSEAWMQRIQSGQAGDLMVNIVAGQLAPGPIKHIAGWADRSAS